MAQQYRYRPRDNRTPLDHPVFGHLEWGGIYESPECAGNPDFEPVEAPEPDPEPAAPKTGKQDASPDPAADKPADDPPAATAGDAGKPGRSK